MISVSLYNLENQNNFDFFSSITNEIKSCSSFSDVLTQAKKKNGLPVAVYEGCESFKTAFCASLKSEVTEPLLIIVPEEKQGRILKESLSSFVDNVFVYPAREFIFDPVSSYSKEIEQERINIISRLKNGECNIVISVPDALVQYTVPDESFNASKIVLKLGDEYEISSLIPRLVEMGYKRCDVLEGSGQFSVRGSIIDIFSPAYDKPCRFDYFDNEIDSMGFFDIVDQRRTENVDSYAIVPVSEIFNVDFQCVVDEIQSMLKNATDFSKPLLEKELAAIMGEKLLLGSDKYFSLIHKEKETILDYLTNSKIILFESKKVFDRLNAFEWTTNQTIESLVEKGLAKFKNAEVMMSGIEFLSKIEKNCIVLDSFETVEKTFPYKKIFFNSSKSVTFNRFETELMFESLKKWISEKKKILIAVRSEREASILRESIFDAEMNVVPFNNCLYNGVVSVAYYSKVCNIGGFENEDFVFLSDRGTKAEGAYSTSRKRSKVSKKRSESITSFTDLEVGDIVVHSTFGIGRYCGVERIKSEKVYKDYIKIQYAGTDVLFVPCSNLDMVSKYIGDENVKLSKMGGADWSKKKSKAKSSATGVAKELIALYGERMTRNAYAFSPDDSLQMEFEDLFEYVETDSQLEAAKSIKNDMQSNVPMERLLCGDVGFGKTEVALRAAFKCVVEGKQVAILVPTTILALQHYQTILQRFRTFPITCEMISRFKTKSEQEEIIEMLKRGKVDIVVGTHRILQKDVSFKDLGLIIVDEEQRFGVKDKEKLKEIAKNVHSLSLTATPIPRTLSMAISGIREMSVLDEAPMDRQPIQTFVLEHEDSIVFEAMRRELRRGGQVFYLHNRVDTIYSKVEKIRKEFPDKNIDVAHGKMNRSQLSAVWQSLVDGETDILVCTTIIETGVDVPNANTLIIEDANKMGVSQLHQIRGRVGRSSRKAYAYLTYKSETGLSDIASKRLEAIREYTEFGSGFRIAMRDLELRGAGNVLGTSQSGHMDDIGYELYVRILENAVLELKGEATKEENDCTVSFNLDAYIPEYFITSDNIRMEIYKKIAEVNSKEIFDDLNDEIIDRFGVPPKCVSNLIKISLLRNLARKVGIDNIVQNGDCLKIFVISPDENLPSYICKNDRTKGRIFFSNSEKAYFSLRMLKNEDVLEITDFIISLFIEFFEKINKTM